MSTAAIISYYDDNDFFPFHRESARKRREMQDIDGRTEIGGKLKRKEELSDGYRGEMKGNEGKWRGRNNIIIT